MCCTIAIMVKEYAFVSRRIHKSQVMLAANALETPAYYMQHHKLSQNVVSLKVLLPYKLSRHANYANYHKKLHTMYSGAVIPHAIISTPQLRALLS